MKPTVVLLRHLVTPLDNDIIHGRIDDFPREAVLARFERAAPGIVALTKPVRVYTDSTARCQLTADILTKAGVSTHMGIQPHVIADVRLDEGILPWDMGKYTGRDAGDNKLAIRRYITQDVEKPLPDGESYMTFLRRWLTFLRRVMQESGRVRERGSILVCCHGSNVLAALSWHERGSRGYVAGDTKLSGLDNGRWLALQHDGEKWEVRHEPA